MDKLIDLQPKRIAIFRALQLGDLLCAIPAVRALKKNYPNAEITLLGLPWASTFVKRFSNYFSDFIPFPGYPGLIEHPGHEIASRQMTGFGGMLSFLIRGDAGHADQLISNLKYFSNATSLGGVESLIERRASVEGPQSTTPPNLVRVSVGLEHLDDLLEDFEQAFQNI